MTPEEIAALPYRPCVGVMLVNRSGQIFVGQRIDAPKLGTQDTAWQMPQGGVDPGEDPRDAALRELWEETGVVADLATIEAEHPDWLAYDLPHDIVPKIWKGRYRGQEQKWFLLRFHGEDTDVNIAMDHPEFAQWRWIGADEIIDHIVPFKREIYRAVIEEFQHRL